MNYKCGQTGFGALETSSTQMKLSQSLATVKLARHNCSTAFEMGLIFMKGFEWAYNHGNQ